MAKGEGELSEEETIAGAVAGKVHAMALVSTAVKSSGALVETGVVATGVVTGGAVSTQQQVFWPEQHAHCGAAAEVESVWADAIN